MRGQQPDYTKFNPQPKPEPKEKKPYRLNKVSDKAKAKKEEKKQLAIELDGFCKELYISHPTKRCFECNGPIQYHTKMNSHHLIKKKDQDKYNIDLTLNADNIILVCFEDHSKAETNIDFVPKIKAETERIKKEFEKYLI